ncbi:MAG TPA: hypothetical protein VLL52_00145 [Anaerolineae bacterium]|nr:hypothetical protein [Anaerolineae bacterium]
MATAKAQRASHKGYDGLEKAVGDRTHLSVALPEIGILLIFVIFGLLILPLCMVPDIAVKDDEFQLRTLFGLISTPWIEFSQITKIIYIPFFQGMVYVAVKNAGWLFSLYGLALFWWTRGAALFMFTNHLDNYSDFMKVFRAKRPDLFNKAS